MTVAINLAELPDPEIIESLDYETIVAESKAYLISLYPDEDQEAITRTLQLESEPLVKFIELQAYKELTLRARYNDEAKALILAKSTGANLDHIAFTYFRGETRLVITEADDEANPPIEEVLESDDDFRNRVALKPESYSTAGPTQAYEYYARTSSGQVKDASATSPVPGTSLITILSRDGNGTPSPELLAVVDAYLSDETIRPQCEEVIVAAADIIEYSLNVTLYVFTGPDSSMVEENANNALLAYTSSAHKLGFNVSHSALDKAAHQSGVQHVDVEVVGAVEIDDQVVVTKLQAAYCTNIDITVVEVTS